MSARLYYVPQFKYLLQHKQDMFGDIPDSQILLQTAIQIGAIQNKLSRNLWRSWVLVEISQNWTAFVV